MAKKISTKVNYQVTELVNNLNEAATTMSEQKRDFFTTRALYNAKRLSTILNKAKVGALAIAITFGMVACGGSATSEQPVQDSVSVDTATTVQPTDTVTAMGGNHSVEAAK